MAAGRAVRYAPWSRIGQSETDTRILVSDSPLDGLALFDLKTRISHRWADRSR